jgi:hypothetical protein
MEDDMQINHVMKTYLFILLMVVGGLLMPSTARTASKHREVSGGLVRLMIDGCDEEALPRNFRKMNDPLRQTGEKPPSVVGLSGLRASGSGQFSAKELVALRKALGKGPAIIVDLRQESHGFVNGIAISWCGEGNCTNLGKSREEVLKDEQGQLDDLKKKLRITACEFKSRKKNSPGQFFPEEMKPREVMSEAELARASGFGYMRFPIPDHRRPQDDEVNRFLAFVRNLPEGTWLHFHCRAGVGRTTTFLAMYDMMQNASRVSLADIIRRQVLLGGMDLSIKSAMAVEGDLAPYSLERAEFVARFYDYCRANTDKFKTPWTAP